MKIFTMADIHGSSKPVKLFYKRNKDTGIFDEEENYMILLGDSGLNFFFNSRDENIKQKLGKYPFTYFVIRGNHESRVHKLFTTNSEEWAVDMMWGNVVYYEKKFPYIKYASDLPTMYAIPNGHDGYYNTLVMPGAYSVDKFYRLSRSWTWFEDEQMTMDEMDFGLKLLDNYEWKCDLVLSHTCPCCFIPTDLFLPTIDQSMVDTTTEQYLGKIEYVLDYKVWLWGHYHQFRDYPRDDVKKKLMLYNDYAIDLIKYIEAEMEEYPVKY